MIVGIGTDIVECAVFRNLKNPEKWFDAGEIEYCIQKWYPQRHYAARWAAKEAFIKSLKLKMSVGMKNIVVKLENGVPKLVFEGDLKPYNNSYNFHVSMSHTPEYATATVIVEEKSCKYR